MGIQRPEENATEKQLIAIAERYLEPDIEATAEPTEEGEVVDYRDALTGQLLGATETKAIHRMEVQLLSLRQGTGTQAEFFD